MKYRRLGRTDLRVSVMGVGTWQLSGDWGKTFEQAEADAMLRRAKELGVNLIDTAECYGEHTSEKLVGAAVKSDRDDWVIATKFGHVRRGNEADQAWSAADVGKQLEESLKALQTDHIDIYQFHSGPDDAFDNDELWAMLDKQKQAGKIRHLGISIRQKDAVHQAKAAAGVGVNMMQVYYNRINRGPEEDVLPVCIENDLGVLARVPLASGFLSGKYRPGDSWPEGDVRHRRDREQVDEMLRQVEDIRKNEVPEGADMAAWALAWCLGHPAVTSVIPGCKSVEQIEANVRLLDFDGARKPHPQEWKDG